VAALLVASLAVEVSVNVAPGTTASEESASIPCKPPVFDCAPAETAKTTEAATSAVMPGKRMIIPFWNSSNFDLNPALRPSTQSHWR
jgi:hypothetical protein